MIGDLAAKRIPGGQNFVASCCAGLCRDEHCIGKLGEHESIGKGRGRTVDDNEGEFLTPGSQQISHARGGDQFRGAGRMSARMHNGKRRESCDGLLEWENGFACQYLTESRIGGSIGRGRGAEVGIDKQHRRAVLCEDGGQAEGELRCMVGVVRARRHILRARVGDGDDLGRTIAMREQKGCAEAVKSFEERRFLDGDFETGLGTGLER